MNPLSKLSRILLVAIATAFLTVAGLQAIKSARASIASRPAVELGYVKPWSVHPENRAAFRMNPEVLS